MGVRLQRAAGTNPCSEVFLAEGARLQISSDLNSIHVYLFSSISCFLFIYFEGEGILPCQTLLLNSHYSPNHLSIFLHPLFQSSLGSSVLCSSHASLPPQSQRCCLVQPHQIQRGITAFWGDNVCLHQRVAPTAPFASSAGHRDRGGLGQSRDEVLYPRPGGC